MNGTDGIPSNLSYDHPLSYLPHETALSCWFLKNYLVLLRQLTVRSRQSEEKAILRAVSTRIGAISQASLQSWSWTGKSMDGEVTSCQCPCPCQVSMSVSLSASVSVSLSVFISMSVSTPVSMAVSKSVPLTSTLPSRPIAWDKQNRLKWFCGVEKTAVETLWLCRQSQLISLKALKMDLCFLLHGVPFKFNKYKNWRTSLRWTMPKRRYVPAGQ